MTTRWTHRTIAGFAVLAGTTMAACGGGDSLEDGWAALSEEDRASVCALFDSQAVDDAVLDQIVAAANETDGPDVTTDEFRELLEEHC